MDYRYRIFYRWDGKTYRDPFATEKTPEEVAYALERAPREMLHRLDDRDAAVTTEPIPGEPHALHVVVHTKEDRSAVTRALEVTLSDWRLYGDIL